MVSAVTAPVQASGIRDYDRHGPLTWLISEDVTGGVMGVGVAKRKTNGSSPARVMLKSASHMPMTFEPGCSNVACNNFIALLVSVKATSELNTTSKRRMKGWREMAESNTGPVKSHTFSYRDDAQERKRKPTAYTEGERASSEVKEVDKSILEERGDSCKKGSGYSKKWRASELSD